EVVVIGGWIPSGGNLSAVTSDGVYALRAGKWAALPRHHHARSAAAGAWQKLPDMPTARGGLGAAIVNGKLVAAGGEQPTRVFDTVEAFDLATGAWSAEPPLKTGRHGVAVAAVGPSLFAIDGGLQPGGAQPTNVAE